MKPKFVSYRLFLIVFLLTPLFNCKKEAIKTAPTVTISAVTNITSTSATSGGDVTSDGGATVTAKGICWGTNQNPSTSDSKTANGSGTGIFTSSITGLNPGGTYYIRAYATNSVETAYSSQATFTTIALAPVLTTMDLSAITTKSASGGGSITNDGGSAVTARGVCWNNRPNPTTAYSKTTDGTGTGTFTSSLTGLRPETIFYLRSYATNSAGTGYGNEISFKTLSTNTIGILFNPNLTYGTMSDNDGNVYKTITIGTKVWMAENLKTTKYRNGEAIPNVTVNASWDELITGAYCWYNNDVANKATYGGLYNWYAVADIRNIAPAGWHVPTDAELTTLTTYLGGESVVPDKLKEVGTSHWYSSGATNSSGFTALPGGYRRKLDGSFNGVEVNGIWWSGTETGAEFAWYRILSDGNYMTFRFADDKRNGFSVRCVRD
jgi:uncharacterized protein (TIGR02145 family)